MILLYHINDTDHFNVIFWIVPCKWFISIHSYRNLALFSCLWETSQGLELSEELFVVLSVLFLSPCRKNHRASLGGRSWQTDLLWTNPTSLALPISHSLLRYLHRYSGVLLRLITQNTNTGTMDLILHRCVTVCVCERERDLWTLQYTIYYLSILFCFMT